MIEPPGDLDEEAVGMLGQQGLGHIGDRWMEEEPVREKVVGARVFDLLAELVAAHQWDVEPLRLMDSLERIRTSQPLLALRSTEEAHAGDHDVAVADEAPQVDPRSRQGRRWVRRHHTPWASAGLHTSPVFTAAATQPVRPALGAWVRVPVVAGARDRTADDVQRIALAQEQTRSFTDASDDPRAGFRDP